jgi:hypothetical protein
LDHDRTYHLSSEVACDWHRTRTLLSHATATTNPDEQIVYLQAALAPVEGRPGDDAPAAHYHWLRDDHTTYTTIETALVDAAHQLGQLALDRHNPDLARWAATKGLTAVPGQEALHRIQMQAAHQAGDPNGVETAYRAASRSAQALSAWDDVEPETQELYAKPTRRQP